VPAHDRSDKSHQPLGFAEVAAPNRLDHNKKGIVDFVVEFLRAQLAAEVEAYAPRK
jgi:hypothetical protein